jgi:hypothetical protein
MDPIYEAGLKRRWIQTDGLPLPAEIRAVRDEIDCVTHVEVLANTSRVILFGPSPDGKAIGPAIGALDLMPEVKARIDQRCQQAEEDALRAETRGQPGSGEPGDTIIRPFDPKNRQHLRALEAPVISSGDDELGPLGRLPRLVGGIDTLDPVEKELLRQLDAGAISPNDARAELDRQQALQPTEEWPMGKIISLAILGAMLALIAIIASGGGFGQLPSIVIGG